MLSYFAPGYIKEAHLVLKNARKLLNYKKDTLSEASVADFETTIGRLEKAIKERDRVGVEAAAQQLDTQWSGHLPPASEAAWRENVEVFLVAIVIAIGVRTYFLQPFTIPTGSMQPTLNGIIGTPMAEPPPGIVRQVVDFVMRGRNYINVVATSDDTITGMEEKKMLFFFTYTDITCTHSSYRVWAPVDTLRRNFDVEDGTIPGLPPSQFHAGDVIARGSVDTGDHVFVDKVSYNLHLPTRGEVFVFSTRGIPLIDQSLRTQGVDGSQFYIKRLAGLPLDHIQVHSPELYINGEKAMEFGFQRVMSRLNGYRGYSNPYDAAYINTPDSSITVPPNHYFAMGDNSYNSWDSRFWGPVPEGNLMGRALFVYWPFLPHWGFVK